MFPERTIDLQRTLADDRRTRLRREARWTERRATRTPER